MPEMIQSFWHTFVWSANPWIRDQSGRMLTRPAYDRIAVCTLARMGITRTGPAEYVITIPRPTHPPRSHSMAKLRRWVTALLLSSPDIPIGSIQGTHIPLRLRHAPTGMAPYAWSYQGGGVIAGRPLDADHDPTQQVNLLRQDDGIHWCSTGPLPVLGINSPNDQQRIGHQLQARGFVFEAHPQLHRFPWSVPDTTSNESVLAALKRQAYEFHKKELAKPLGALLDRLDARASTDEWQRAALTQTPKQAWDHSHGLTDFQVWTGYRIATRQLNFHHAERSANNECRKRPGCRGNAETPAHLFWYCPYAQALWAKLVSHWTGERPSTQRTQQFFNACASRRAHFVPPYRTAILDDRFQEDRGVAEQVWKRIWHILATICHTKLWTDRNDAVYNGTVHDLAGTTQSFWTSCVCQLRAIATREHRKEASAMMGAVQFACIELLEYAPEGSPGMSGPSLIQPPDQPGLNAWLRIYQRSCT